MAEESKKTTIVCHQCKTNECLDRYPNGVPDFCQANKFWDVIERAKAEYFQPEDLKIHIATAKILKRGNEQWPRVMEAIEFARELGVSKVGLAVCVGLVREGREFARFLNHAGLEVISVACMIGGMSHTDTGIPEELAVEKGISCNPIAQAEILNQEGTGLNFIYGLCMGHDTLFIRHSEAPVTYIAVKDFATGNNPTAALFSPFLRRRIWEAYSGDKV